ncbi:MAG TPA: hypothetical protein VJ464_16785 [Blastocatellia bacterium]|nr:hypothetical protein [Blastocatellia bacterium]
MASDGGNPVDFILSKLRQKKRSGRSWVGLCPAHDDKRFSLSVTRGGDGRALLNCHAGCSIDSICEALGISKADLFTDAPPPKPQRTGWEIVATYDYHDRSGGLLYQHVRYRNKQFTWRAPDGQGGWRYGLYAAWFERWNDGDWRAAKDGSKNVFDDPGKRPHADARWFGEVKRTALYKEARLIEAGPGSVILYVEGEKDADTGTRLEFVATTAGGASDWRVEFAGRFAQLNLVIIPDNDQAGERLAAKVAADCYGVAETVRVLRLPGLNEHGDLSDWENAGGNRDALSALIEDTPLYQPEVAQDETISRAKEETRRAIERAVDGMRHDDTDPPISEDKNKERLLRLTGREAARVVDMILVIMAALGFEGNHHRIINALIAYAKKLPNPFVYFMATHSQLYQKYRRSKTVKDRSKTALVGADTARLRAEQEALGCEMVSYIPGKMNPDTGQGYGSRYRLQILRFALIAINLADSVGGEFERRWQADEWAAQQVAEMIPRAAPRAEVKVKPGRAASLSSRTPFDEVEKAFFDVYESELERVIQREVNKCSGPEVMGEAVDEITAPLIGKLNRMASEALCRGLAAAAEIEQEGGAGSSKSLVHESMDLPFDQTEMGAETAAGQIGEPLVHESMDIGAGGRGPIEVREDVYLSRNRNTLPSMPSGSRAGRFADEPSGLEVFDI